jgi:presenilin-like A22 family membrane protease
LIKILDDVTLPSKYSPSNSRFNRNKPIIFFLITGGIIAFALFFGYKQNVEPNADIPAKSIGAVAGFIIFVAVMWVGRHFLGNNKRWRSF